MNFTPMCPKCGSVAVEKYTNHGLSCTRCGHDGRTDTFRPGADMEIDNPDRLRRAGWAEPSRTIPLSDEERR